VLRDTFEFIQEREDLVRGAEQVPYAAVLINTRQHVLGKHSKEPYDSLLSEDRFLAVHRLLMEIMIPHHLITEDILLKRLDDFKIVIISDQRCLSNELMGKLNNWVGKGGILIATELSGTKDEDGIDRKTSELFELLGIEHRRTYPHKHAYVEVTGKDLMKDVLDMPHIAEVQFEVVSITKENVRTIAELRGVYLRGDGKYLRRLSPPNTNIEGPAITVRQVGNGHAVYFAGDLFGAYDNKNQWNIKNIIRNMIDNLVEGNKPVGITSPAWLETVLAKKIERDGREKTIIHLINHHGSFCSNGKVRFLERVIPINDVKMKIRTAKKPKTVTLEPEHEELGWQYEKGFLVVDGFSVGIHSAVVIEM
jgi:hypothetical protein